MHSSFLSRARAQLKQLFTNKWVSRAGFFLTLGMYVAAVYITVRPEAFVRYGYLGVFVFNLAGPGTLLIPIMMREGFSLWGIAVATALGMTCNDSLSYVAGRLSATAFAQSRRMQQAVEWLGKYDILAIFLLATVPFPLDFIAMVAGHVKFPYSRFFAASILGKILRNLLVGFLVLQYGDQFFLWLERVVG